VLLLLATAFANTLIDAANALIDSPSAGACSAPAQPGGSIRRSSKPTFQYVFPNGPFAAFEP
jgi:hypothetical protein